MPVRSDLELRRSGTRFRIFPQLPLLAAFQEPETVWLSPPAGTIRPGPADDLMYVRDPVNKTDPYEHPRYMPPYLGPIYPPAQPGPDGHFDHLDVTSREFQAAHMYAGVRRVLDIWEGYLGKHVQWHFREQYSRLELIPFVDWGNAQAGYGFIEAGHGFSEDMGEIVPLCMNFDVLAHEVGHIFIFGLIDTPPKQYRTAEFLGFNETAADLIALISVLHIDSVINHVLSSTRGNLYITNELNRLGELSETEQLRIIVNNRKMSDFSAGWTDVHPISLPLTGAIFDIFVEIYLEYLLEQGLISKTLTETSLAILNHPKHELAIQRQFEQAYQGNQEQFKAALVEARDYLGFCSIKIWQRLSTYNLRYTDVEEAFISADQELTGGRHREKILECFEWREIGLANIGPQLPSPKLKEMHVLQKNRTFSATNPFGLSYREKMAIALQQNDITDTYLNWKTTDTHASYETAFQ